MENFNYPYISRSIQEFWRRWHISLSTWFRDYLYIPLGGNRAGTVKTYRNLVSVFFLCGLWHGASWNFVIWGMFRALALRLGEGGHLLPEAAIAAKLAALSFGLSGRGEATSLLVDGEPLPAEARTERVGGWASNVAMTYCFCSATSSS